MRCCAALVWLLAIAAPAVGQPVFAPSGPNAAAHGAEQGFPVGTWHDFHSLPNLVGSYSHLDQIFRARPVLRPSLPSELRRAPNEPPLRYDSPLGPSSTVDDYLGRVEATGLLLARDDTILVERYQYGRTDRHRFTSWSMAKTVTSMLIGIALAEGKIGSVEDLAESYLPELKGTQYGATTLRHLLTMSSGVQFREVYDGKDDSMQLGRDTFAPVGIGGLAGVQRYNERAAPAGTRFSYASAETEVLGLVLERATGRPLADYLSEKIWQPIGAEADASWLIDSQGKELGYCCLNAVLRDYARLGLLLAHDGNWRGRQLIPAQWLADATVVRPGDGHLKPSGGFFGYGYQVWILPGERRQFVLRGIRGQVLFVDPAARLVMVQTSVRPAFRDLTSDAETLALWRAAVAQLAE
jgi:CubicO group peptidase (beta-lactamase class C family)